MVGRMGLRIFVNTDIKRKSHPHTDEYDQKTEDFFPFSLTEGKEFVSFIAIILFAELELIILVKGGKKQ